MPNLNLAVEVALEDFHELERVIRRELKTDADRPVPTALREAGYQEQLIQLNKRILQLIDQLKEELESLQEAAADYEGPPDVDAGGEGGPPDRKTDDLHRKIMDIADLLSKLVVVGERLESYLTMIEYEVGAAAGTVGTTSKFMTAKGWVSNVLLPWIRRVAGQIWSLLKHLATPREWKLSGQIGDMLGMTKVGVEITFGK